MSAQTKNVLFIGLTQAGKSSTIQSILRYAQSGGENIIDGRGPNNTSRAQGIVPHQCTVTIQDHFLEHTYTLERIEPNENTSSDGLVNVSIPTGETLLLNLIDTPGIDDSLDDSLLAFKDDSGIRGAIAEEQHKIRILLHLSRLATLHAVVFVVRHNRISSHKFQRMVQALFEILNPVCPNLVYHCIHTAAPTALILSNQTPTTDNSHLQLISRGITHYFLENYPVNHNTLAVYATNKTLAALLTSLAGSEANNTQGLKYPKSDAILASESEIQRAYDYISDILTSKIDSLTHQTRDVQNGKSRDEASVSAGKTTIAELERGKFESQLEQIRADLLKLTAFERNIPVLGNQASLGYLSFGSVLCTARAYALTFEFDIKWLPLLPKPTSQVRETLVRMVPKQYDLIRLKDEICNNLLAHRIPKTAIVSHLTELDHASDDSWQRLQSERDRIERLTTRTKISRASSEQLSRIIGLADARVANCANTIRNLLGDQTKNVLQARRILQSQKEEAEELIGESRIAVEKWQLSRQGNERALEAAKMALRTIEKPRWGVGELTVLRRTGEEDPYASLYREMLWTLEAKALNLEAFT